MLPLFQPSESRLLPAGRCIYATGRTYVELRTYVYSCTWVYSCTYVYSRWYVDLRAKDVD